jgi:CRP/FNR family transcriptional regulator
MRQLDFTTGETGACAMPRPLTVKFDQIAVDGIGANKETLIFYIDFSSTPTEQIKLEPAHLEFVGSAPHAIHRGKALYHAGGDCTHLFVVRSGSFKSVVSNATGLAQVVGFRMTGEVLGLCGSLCVRCDCH